MPERKVYSISELTKEIKGLLEYDFQNIYITGEISNFRVPASGHYYFTLKDEGAQIRAVMFRQTNLYMRFVPKDGMQVLGKGRISVYEPQGSYQVILDYMEPTGIGALKQAYDDLKRKLRDEGLFDDAKKKALPEFLQSVGVVTSATGAAIRDFLSVANRRFTNMRVIIYPVRVQGDGAGDEIAGGIEYFNRAKNVDAIVIMRGGGSFEDLFSFSKEVVARAVYDSVIPVISAVGHETDYSISDFAADLRAPTPSAAAELIIAEKDELSYRISNYTEKLSSMINYIFLEETKKVAYYERALGDPKRRLEDLMLRVDDLTSHLMTLMKSRISAYNARIRINEKALGWSSLKSYLSQKEDKLTMLRQQLIRQVYDNVKYASLYLNEYNEKLDLANPFHLLKKGYSITYESKTRKIIKNIKGIRKGDLLDIKLGAGSIECIVNDINED